MTDRPINENKSFTSRCIAKAQSRSIAELEIQAITGYLVRFERLAYDPSCDLFFVETPQDGWAVAVWMMPATQNPIS